MFTPTLLALTLFASSSYALTAEEWRPLTIYQVLTDRFARPDSVTGDCNIADKTYCGGTFAALQERLPYIQGMGFDAIWISPVVTNIEATTALGEAYHGYWTADNNGINAHYGTADELKALSAAVHAAGMYIMFDVVVNHVAAQTTTTFAPDAATYGPLDAASDYHPFCFISDYNNQTDVEQCWLGDTTVALVDVDTEDQSVIDYYNTWIAQLVSDYSVDGLRIDTVKHVRKDFWPAFAAASGVFTMGEVLDGGVPYNAPYQEVMDSILNYPLYYQLGYAFENANANMGALQELHDQMKTAMKDTTLLGTFLDNHDQPRFASYVTDLALIENAYIYPFVTDGIPILYYGQEQGFTGGADPANREAMWTSNYSTSGIGYTFTKQLTALRKAAGQADINFYTTQSTVVMATAVDIVIKKGGLVSILTNRGTGASATITLPANTLVQAKTVVDALTCTSWGTDKFGGSTVTINSGQPVLIIPLSDIGDDLCPNGVTASTLTTGSTDTTPNDPQTSTTRAASTTAVTPTATGAGASGAASATSTAATGGAGLNVKIASSSIFLASLVAVVASLAL